MCYVTSVPHAQNNQSRSSLYSILAFTTPAPTVPVARMTVNLADEDVDGTDPEFEVAYVEDVESQKIV